MSEPGTFITSWLKTASAKAHDQAVLKAIDACRTMEALDESKLLASILALSKAPPTGAQDAYS